METGRVLKNGNRSQKQNVIIAFDLIVAEAAEIRHTAMR
jgi:hypothetical protein